MSRPRSLNDAPADVAQTAKTAPKATNATTAQNNAGRSRGSSGTSPRRPTVVTSQATETIAPTGFASVAPTPRLPGRCSGNVSRMKNASARSSRNNARTKSAIARSASSAVFGEYAAVTPRTAAHAGAAKAKTPAPTDGFPGCGSETCVLTPAYVSTDDAVAGRRVRSSLPPVSAGRSIG